MTLALLESPYPFKREGNILESVLGIIFSPISILKILFLVIISLFF